MHKSAFYNFVATIISIAALCIMTSAMVRFFTSPSEWLFDSSLACMLLLPISLYFWFGVGAKKFGNPSTVGWLMMSLGGLLIAGVFFVMDCGFDVLFHAKVLACHTERSGFAFLFTLAAAGAAVIFFSSAIRVGILNIMIGVHGRN